MNEQLLKNLTLVELESLYKQLPQDGTQKPFDLTNTRRNEYLEWLKENTSVTINVSKFLKSIAVNEFTLHDVMHSHEVWNEYEAALLAVKLLEAEDIATFSPNCIAITLKNNMPSKSSLLEISGSANVFSSNLNAPKLEEYIEPTNSNQYYGLGVLLYSLVTGEYLLPNRFRGIKKYNLSVSLKRFFSNEAFDDSFTQLVIELVDPENSIDKATLTDKLKAIIDKFKDKIPFFISARMATSSNQATYDESIKISIGQLIYNPLAYFHHAIGKSKEPDSSKQIDTILYFIDEACKESDLLILPELSLPRKYMRVIKRKLHSLDKDLMIISGISFEKLNSKTMLNQGVLLDRHNEIIFNKLQPSPTIEAKELKTYGMRLKPTNKINIYEHKKFGRFAVLICYDFLSLPIQDLLYKKIDTLFILAFNSDVSGFEFTAEAFVRMSLINVVMVNCGNYGGSLAISPLRDVHKRVRMIIKGNDVNSINTIKIPVNALYQYKQNRNLNTTNFLCENGCVDDQCQMRFIEYPAHFSSEG
jgi:predicted amidohydrolase